ncbi:MULTISPECIES: urease accessory protein UreF [unclassified Mesorhizobium]|uniref:urease accessory protein UreF n=1 Tax=unclassified Mesorhizobium TaxID=325217 RepID=UPI00112A37FB|nr:MULTISPECIES: urease accessory protein UreF [unclassified Mesorhizobium]MBZ9960719.1 urease accessory protein UreF [Mesorhizobium sp. BR1-1-14]MCA0027539.1 urease accessory protein UreF [Mesorhizobium sp. B263B1A]MCA0059785.1 urease accessory protein UreF [Mesorhizobium sp. B261B1A]TPK01543.1 urease accessory protein UreF [Mesorhizobium sp. B2-5-12]TPK26630.1 urease accessory protein UreF [Mesorhizobium sp. B2-5-6]
MITTTDQPSGIALLRLMAWLSPVFPVGGFSYSHGLERAVHDGLVTDAAGLAAWLETLVEMGSAWNDAVLFAESWRNARDGGDLAEVAALAEALAGSRERHAETMLQGAAFLKAAAAWPNPVRARLPAECAYCVAVGAVAGGNGIALPDALSAFLQAFFSNLVQAAIRLGVIGQSDAVMLLASFEVLALATAARASRSTMDDLGGCAFVSDIVAMQHETQYSRLFRS